MRTCGDCIHFVCNLTGKYSDGKWKKFCAVGQKVVSDDNIANSSCFSPWRIGALLNNV